MLERLRVVWRATDVGLAENVGVKLWAIPVCEQPMGLGPIRSVGPQVILLKNEQPGSVGIHRRQRRGRSRITLSRLTIGLLRVGRATRENNAADSTEQVQKRLARVLVRGGADAAAHIADGFGPEPTMLDDRLRELLVIIGDLAVEPMSAAYERSGWLEKVTAGLIRRLNNRRVQIARALGDLGTKPAHKALKLLHKREKDDNLRLHLQRALHGQGEVDG